MLSKISEFLLGGTRGFNEAEKSLLSFLADALPAKDRDILTPNLMAVRKLQRKHNGRKFVDKYKN